ncbi:MAG: SLBB domain-containing protein [Fimbriimonadaceae bacterium]
MRRFRFFVVGFLLLLCAFAVGQGKVIVKPGDSVNVVCEEEPSLSKDYVISRDGFIIMQFIGAVSVAGLREDQAAAKLSATLIEQRILQRATIRLKVLGAAKGGLITYSGAIASPGEFYPRTGLRLSDVVKEAKPTTAADLENIRIITATGQTVLVNFSLFDGKSMVHNPEVRAGDRVFFDLVVKTRDIAVLGMVARPGMVPFTRGLTVKGAIGASGGVTPLADDRIVRITRAGAALPLVNLKSGDLELLAGDEVFVPQAVSTDYVTVTGLVQSPKRVPMQAGLTLSRAVEAAGGALKGADTKKVKLTRSVQGKPKVTTHDYELMRLGRAGDVTLMAEDIIEIAEPKKAGRKRNDLLKIGGIVIIGLLFGILR